MEQSKNNKYHLMQITHDLAIGGLQRVVVNLCRTINRNIFDISVLCLRSRGEFASDIEEMGIDVITLPQKNSKPDYFSFCKVAKILRQRKIDIIHTHNTQPFIDGTIGALLSNVKTIVHTDHARDFPDKKRYMFAEWFMSHFAYKVVGVSEHTSQNLNKYEHISPKKIQTIVNGVDSLKYDISIDKEKKRKELGIREKGPVIGLGVRLEEQKGITYLLKAMPEVIKRFPDVSLVIAGKGKLEDTLKKEASFLRINDNVFFIGPRLDMPDLLKLFDLYVLPSLWEGLPMVLLEAMAARCPIIASDVGGNHMAVEHGKNGLLVKSKSPEALSKEIIKLLSNNGLREQFSDAGKVIFDNKFSAQIMTKQYEKLYLKKPS